jgi:protein-S-isoprenylcysteine O-methyltransferase
MFTGLYQSGIILAVAVAYYIIDLLLISRYDRERNAEGSGRNWGFTLFAVVVLIFLIAQPILLPWLGLYTDAWWGGLLQAVGILFLLGGFGLHWWARSHLRQFYAERVEIQPEHQVVTSGPYAYVRHPMFVSYFMVFIGLLLVNPSLPMLLATVYVVWDFSRAARKEERLLNEHVPGYADYMARTSRFLPRLRKRSGGK